MKYAVAVCHNILESKFCWSERFAEMTRISHHKRVKLQRACALVAPNTVSIGALFGSVSWIPAVYLREHTHTHIYAHRLKHARAGSDALPLPDLIRRLHNRGRIDGSALRSPVHETEHVQEKRGRLCKHWCVIWVPVHTFFLYPSAELRLACVCTDAMFPAASLWWGSDTHWLYGSSCSTPDPLLRPTGSRPPRSDALRNCRKKDLTIDHLPDFDLRFLDIGPHKCIDCAHRLK